MQYRLLVVDGLRALAVLPVILYHAKLPYFQGGFVGVDVFCNQWILDHKNYTVRSIHFSFSLVNFYERRARRILPALFCVLTLSTALAWFLLPPNELKDFGQSLFSVSFFFLFPISFFGLKDTLILELILNLLDPYLELSCGRAVLYSISSFCSICLRT